MFEKHYQMIMEAATQYLINAMENFEKREPDAIKTVVDEESAEAFVLHFLEESKISFFFSEDQASKDNEDADADDLITYCRDMVSRLVISLIFDRCEKEEDPVGLRGVRRLMIAYFLSAGFQGEGKQGITDFLFYGIESTIHRIGHTKTLLLLFVINTKGSFPLMKTYKT